MTSHLLTADQVADYHDQGFTLSPGLFNSEEIELLRRAAKEDSELDKHAYEKADGEGGRVRLSLWNHPGDGIYGTIARSQRMVDNAELLLGGEVYHYHSKMIMKEPKVGGAWTWH
ncbi:MAG: phytanoyl-CoA dioxygenase family protein, partial [bacterium]|nr:phytanoyl-CoA dioxygenase family protein [bacterium]